MRKDFHPYFFYTCNIIKKKTRNAMLYTLTTNPAIDMNISTSGIRPAVVNRTFDTVYTPNGKGLNVSFVLEHFGIPSQVLGFFGGFSGRYIVDEVRQRGYGIKPVWVDETTRINIFLNDGEDEYKFVNSGSFVPEQCQQELLRIVEDSDDMTVLSISGSLPPGIDPDFYQEIMKLCEKKGVDVILDISAPKLKQLLAYGPLLIKPNDEEIEEIFGIRMNDEKDIVDTLHTLHEYGARNILLTLGNRGSYFYNGKKVYRAGTQQVKLLSSACAGDAALAGFMSVWLVDPNDIERALRRSAATGANVAESCALGDLAKVDDYYKNIKVNEVKK